MPYYVYSVHNTYELFMDNNNTICGGVRTSRHPI